MTARERLVTTLREADPDAPVRGTASDLVLAAWRRIDPMTLHVDGDPAVLQNWPSV
ncbi:hypothetical protein [Pseudonocardia ailaonensis]|uniref:hypothetical protein n=1 Tax=Pseudonocardia ailaonensis TaxID=367279 RepID=UPI0031D7E386